MSTPLQSLNENENLSFQEILDLLDQPGFTENQLPPGIQKKLSNLRGSKFNSRQDAISFFQWVEGQHTKDNFITLQDIKALESVDINNNGSTEDAREVSIRDRMIAAWKVLYREALQDDQKISLDEFLSLNL